MRSLFVCLAFACLSSAAAFAGPRNQGYTPLSGEQIRDAFSDRTLTASGHAPLRFSGDGRVEGSREASAWSVEANTLCLQGAGRTCFDVWRKGREIQMFAGEDEGEGALTGVLQ